MTDHDDPTTELWTSIQRRLGADDRITPQLHGFINLEVPNDLTRGMLEQRIRIPLLEALADLDTDVVNFAIVVNPDIQPALQPVPDETLEVSSPIEQVNPVIELGRRSDSRLNPKYNFDNFVIGGSNRFAHAAAVA